MEPRSGEGRPMTVCHLLDRRAEKQAEYYQRVLEFARSAFRGVLPDAKTYIEVGVQAEEKFKEADYDSIHLAVSEARRELRKQDY